MTKKRRRRVRKDPQPDERNDVAESVVSSIRKACGEEAAVLMNDYEDCLTCTPRMWVPTGFRWIDQIVSNGRGLPCGKIGELFGAEGTGKTALTQFLIREYQRAGGLAVYLDFETSLDKSHLKEYKIDLGNLVYVDVETVEEGFNAMNATLSDLDESAKNLPVLFAWDSVAMAVPEAELKEKDHSDSHIALLARAMSKAMRKFRRRIAKSNCTALFTNQVREKPGIRFGPSTVTPGGRALKFASSFRLQTSIKKTLTVTRKKGGKERKVRNGFVVNVRTVKTRFAPPLYDAEFILSFKRGPDPISSLKHYMKDIGLLKAVGSSLKISALDVSIPAKEWRSFAKEKKKEIDALLSEYENEFFGEVGED